MPRLVSFEKNNSKYRITCGRGALDYAAYIDGAFVKGEGTRFAVENPSDESVVAEVQGVSPAQADAAIAAARRAFDDGGWPGLSMKERAAHITRYGAALRKRADFLKDCAIREAGCPVSSTVMGAQVHAPLRMTDEIADLFLRLPGQEDNPLPVHERANPHFTVQSLKRWSPLGVVSAISAYNVPFYTAFWKVVPALMAGDTVILRPNPLTPMSAMVFAEAAEEAGLPPGVLNVIVEQALDGARAMTTDPRVDMVSFTGSCSVGTQVAAQAAPTMKRLVLELGGKSAQIYLPDAVGRAASAAFTVCTAHAGQGCVLGTRVFVPEDNKAEVLDGMARMLSAVKIGPASDPETQLGPVISAAQRERCEHFTRAAVEAGGKVVCGGKRPEGLARGFYWEPTVLDLPDNRNPAAQEEIFGPVVGVIGYRDLDHAVEMANDSKFGLSGWVHGADKVKALETGLRIRSGTVNVNGALMSSYASSGGIKMSGLGRERGIEGLREFQMMTTLNIGG
ncbi:aldehyde dehydrogenase family protein [Novosphingobium beihaiensis]|uniref:Aldehyde dehydrogenase family protein n=1 Tax=Novosphingobium beihaiensis TaxID=2930389 RepID=A0ABT0BSK3_9SPHN|nr:aldehyde dehydrogenase family protein [Novosphingobium beihaiensis]MCJ2188053.1 aldehyde dehydrogenase family protein [Novosphingobium beihaiensis]